MALKAQKLKGLNREVLAQGGSTGLRVISARSLPSRGNHSWNLQGSVESLREYYFGAINRGRLIF